MGLNEQSKALNINDRKSLFKSGVKVKPMSGKQPIMFRLLPAFDPANPNPATSWVPFIDRNGNLNDFGFILKIARFIGHGSGKTGGRQDILSLQTFETETNKVRCPLITLYEAIISDMNTWGYLLEGKGDKNDKYYERPAFSRPMPHLICNIFDVNQPLDGSMVGIFTPGTTSKLLDRKESILFQPNASPNAEEAIKMNYLWAYANGDITDPNTGPVLIIEKADDKGDYSTYRILIAKDSNGKVIRRPVDQLIMSQRKNMSKPEEFIDIPTEEDIINTLVSLLNGRSPQGYHEWSLLKMAFREHRIPNPPEAPGAMHSISVPSFAYTYDNSSDSSKSNELKHVETEIYMNKTPSSEATTAKMVDNITKAAASVPRDVSVNEPIVPGDKITFDKNAFINKLRSNLAANS